MALMPTVMEVIFCLPHPLAEMWVVWLFVMLFQLNYMFNKKRNHTKQLQKSGELMSFREIAGVGCIGGFILLTFITVFCTYLVMKTKAVL